MPFLRLRLPGQLHHWLVPSVLALGVALLPGCGGSGGGSGTPASPPPSWMVGAWTATGADGSVNYFLIAPTGVARLANSSHALQATGTLTAAGTAVSGSGTIYLPEGETFNDGKAYGPGTVTGTGTQTPPQLALTFSAGGENAQNDFTPDPAYTPTAQLADLAGSYASAAASNSASLALAVTVNADGTFSGTTASGNVTGTLTQAAPGLNMFTVNLTLTPTAGGAPLTGSGLAYYRSAQTGTNPAPAAILIAGDNGTAYFTGLFSRLPAPSLAGLWTGSLAASPGATANPLVGAILADGTFRFVANDATELVGKLVLGSDGTSVDSSGAVAWYPPVGKVLPRGVSPSDALSITGSLVDGTVAAAISGTTASGAAFSEILTLDSLAPADIQLVTMDGPYGANASDVSDALATTFTLDPGGNILNWQNGTGTVTDGVMSLVDPLPDGGNVANVDLVYTALGISKTFSGLALLLPSPVAEPPAVFLMLTSTDGLDALAGGFSQNNAGPPVLAARSSRKAR